jgi:hypothetical protein
MSSTASPVSDLANVLLDHERPRQLDPGLEQDPRLRPRRSLRGLVTLLVLSLVIHGLLIRFLPKWEHPIVDSVSPTQGPLQVTMTPPAAADRAPPPVPSPPQPVKAPPRTVIATNKPSPSMPPIFVPPDTPPQPSRAEATPQPLDFSAALEARRAQRQAQEAFYARQNGDARSREREMSTAEKAEAAFKRNAQTLGQARDGTSGIFQIRSKGSRYAAFSFRGWTTDRTNAKSELIEVDAGLGGDVELAIVRRMIDLIRQHYQGNFNWESHRLGRVVTLSARKEDQAGLEAFLIKEFFG